MKYLRIKYYVDRNGIRKQLLYWEPKKTYFVQGKWQKCPYPAKPIAKIDDYDLLIKALELWRKGNAAQIVIKKDSVHWLAAEYYKDEMYEKLSSKSRKEYKRVLEKNILPIIGDFPYKEVTRQIARTLYHGLRKKRRLAEYVMMVAKRVFAYGTFIDADLINPFIEMEVRRNDPRVEIWKPDQVKAFQAKALEMNRRSMWLAMEIAHTIGTDTTTTRLLARTHFNGTKLTFARGKSGVEVVIPLTGLPALRAAFNDTSLESTQFVTSEMTNRAYTDTNFCHVFREIADKAEIPKNLQFKDLRRTAVGKLHRAGCTVPEIAAIVGWSIDNCNKIIKHYFTDTEETAGNAIVKLVSNKGRET